MKVIMQDLRTKYKCVKGENPKLVIIYEGEKKVGEVVAVDLWQFNHLEDDVTEKIKWY